MFNPKDETIQKHLSNWKSYDKLLSDIKIIIVDDCSKNIIKITPDFKINLVIARIIDDIYWNLTGARNLAMHLADDDWCISTDMDHFIYPGDMENIINLKKENGNVYYFKRLRCGQPWRTHKDSFIIHREDFWKMGGYDEDMRGCRGANEDLIEATMKYNRYNLVQTNIIIHNDEFHGKVELPNRDRVAPNYAKLQKKLIEMKNGKYIKTNHLRFNWEISNEYSYS